MKVFCKHRNRIRLLIAQWSIVFCRFVARFPPATVLNQLISNSIIFVMWGGVFLVFLFCSGVAVENDYNFNDQWGFAR